MLALRGLLYPQLGGIAAPREELLVAGAVPTRRRAGWNAGGGGRRLQGAIHTADRREGDEDDMVWVDCRPGVVAIERKSRFLYNGLVTRSGRFHLCGDVCYEFFCESNSDFIHHFHHNIILTNSRLVTINTTASATTHGPREKEHRPSQSFLAVSQTFFTDTPLKIHFPEDNTNSRNCLPNNLWRETETVFARAPPPLS